MKAQIVRIGNSKGVVIPKAILSQIKVGEGAVLDMQVQDGNIVLAPMVDQPRKGWAEAFALAGTEGSPEPLIDISNDFDATEWTW